MTRCTARAPDRRLAAASKEDPLMLERKVAGLGESFVIPGPGPARLTVCPASCARRLLVADDQAPANASPGAVERRREPWRQVRARSSRRPAGYRRLRPAFESDTHLDLEDAGYHAGEP